MPPVVRRMAAGQAAARAAAAAPAPQPVARIPVVRRPQSVVPPAKPVAHRVVREQAHGHTSIKALHKKEVYYESSNEVNNFLAADFSEADPAAFVRVGGGMTINLQNFESLRIDCSITIPCKRGDIQAAYEMASEFVADRMQQEEQNYLGSATNTEQPGRAR